MGVLSHRGKARSGGSACVLMAAGWRVLVRKRTRPGTAPRTPAPRPACPPAGAPLPSRREHVAERDDIHAGDDPADPTERRDWDLPPDAVEPPAASGEEPEAPGEEPPEPPDGSERRDWDVP